jgi:hypothetical protein
MIRNFHIFLILISFTDLFNEITASGLLRCQTGLTSPNLKINCYLYLENSSQNPNTTTINDGLNANLPIRKTSN